MPVRYIFADDAPLTFKGAGIARPQKIGEALDKIRKEGDGRLAPVDVVDTARDPTNDLHPHFEWDDGKAAQGFRLEQARSLIRCVRLVDDSTESGTARAFISVRAPEGISYRSLSDVKGSADLQAAVLAGAERDLKAFEIRYRELKDICESVRQVREKVSLRRRKASSENRSAA